MLKTSGVVVEQTKIEVGNMGKMIQIMFDEVKNVYRSPQFLTDEKVKELRKIEDDLDLYQKEITDANFVILNNKDINDSLRRDIRNNLIVSDEYETVSDYLMRITNSLKKLQDNVISLTEQEMKVVLALHEKTNEFFRNIDRGYQEKNPILIKECVVDAKEVTALYKDAKKNYMDYGIKEAATTMSTTNFMDIINFYRRVGDHLTNIIEGYTDK